MDKTKSLIIYYFSGTGNAKQIATWFSDIALNNKINCQLFNIAERDNINLQAVDPDALIFIISPVHGFNFPKITIDFIRHFPKGRNKIVLLNTRAGMRIGSFVTPGLTGIAFMLSSFILRRKGYHIKGQIPFDMPSNWISIHPALNEYTVKYLHKKNYSRVEKLAGKIFAGKTIFLSRRDIIQDILISPVSLGYYLAGRFLFAKSFYANINCNNCHLCIKQCPVNAIKLINLRPYWTFNCESCMHCMNYCPEKAIETAHGLIIIISLLGSSLTTLLLTRFIINIHGYNTVRIMLFTIVFFILLWVFYYFQHLLLKNKYIGKFISFLSLTHFNFWGRYKSIPDKKWKS